MAKYAGKYSAKKRVSKSRKSMSKRTVKPSRKFTKMVQKVVHKDVENKIAYRTTGDGLINFNSGIGNGVSPGGDLMFLMPDINKSVDENGRIGEQIRAQKLIVRGHIRLDIDTATNYAPNRRIGVRLMVVQAKRFPSGLDAYNNASSWLGGLLKKGGTTSYFTGQIQDLYAPINTELVTKYYDRVVYLSQSYLKEFVGAASASGQVALDVRSTVKFFNIRIPLRNKKLLYDASAYSNLSPTNFAPILLVGYAHLDGTTPDTATTAVGLCYDSHLEYEDA